MPSNDPIFHQYEILRGMGISIKALLTIFKRGWFLRNFNKVINFYSKGAYVKVSNFYYGNY